MMVIDECEEKTRKKDGKSDMKFDFDRQIDRKNTRSYKWDQLERLFGSPDILPLWVADMDFESPPAVREALVKRAGHGVYGYSVRTGEYFDAITGWYRRRHNWELKPDWIIDSPGVVTSLSIAVDAFSEPGAPVILQSPVYYPFYDVIRLNGRKVAKNPLILKDGKYEMDYGHLEDLMENGAKLLLLCNPHNPGGRVWSRPELERLAELCLKHGVTVVSDEIHCDLALPGHRHTPFASLSEETASITLTCLAATKTFNLPGLQTSFVVASNPEIHKVFDRRIKTLSLHMSGFFAQEAVIAAYNSGEEWLDELLLYIKGNVDFAVGYISRHIPGIKPMEPEGSYLLWVDCRSLGLDAAAIKDLMYNKAGVAFNEGSVYGPEGEGFLRINLGCPRATLERALQRFGEAVGRFAGRLP